MDSERTTSALIGAVDRLGTSERQLLRQLTSLDSDEVATLSSPFGDRSTPLADLALKLIDSWDHMTEPERVASLLVLRETLSRMLQMPYT